MRFLIDMNLSPQWVSYLSSQGFEAVLERKARDGRNLRRCVRSILGTKRHHFNPTRFGDEFCLRVYTSKVCSHQA